VSDAGRGRRLRVRYLLEGTGLFGGVKVALRHAELLAARGHEVHVVSREPAPDWYTLRVPFHHTDDLAHPEAPRPDVTVATYWTTLAPARRGPGAAVHLCQGYEGFFSHNRSEHSKIARAYAAPLPALVVSRHLGEFIEQRFDRPWRWIPQPLEDFWAPRRPPARGGVPRILVVGPFEVDWKGVATALRAVQRLRSSGTDCQLIRLSQAPMGDAERAICEPDEYHQHLLPAEAAQLYRNCDLLLAPSLEPEGFGLPVLEAMASGVPVVAGDVSCYREFASEAARLVCPEDPDALANAAGRLLGDADLHAEQRRAGLDVADRFGGEPCVAALEEALVWAVDLASRRRFSLPRGGLRIFAGRMDTDR
jgi:glycosyltransferase involved in cell wall biosynthesis